MSEGVQDPTMREERLKAVLAAYGADPRRWPVAERAEIEAWRALFPIPEVREAVALDSVLDTLRETEVVNDVGALARILAAAPVVTNVVTDPGRIASRAAPPRPVRAPAKRAVWAGFAAAAIAGIALGYGGGESFNTAGASEELMIAYALAEG